jgi:hypothetical protein
MTLRSQYYREAAKIIREERDDFRSMYVELNKKEKDTIDAVMTLVLTKLLALAEFDEQQSLEHEFDEQHTS